MGQPVVHFEVMGQDAHALQSFYSGLFGWEFENIEAPVTYRLVSREGNLNKDGVGIGGGVGAGAPDSHVTFYVEVPDVGAGLEKAESLGGTRLMGPDKAGPVVIGLFNDPEGHMVGLVEGESQE
jgi:predicted enzyme related to lactoylglutathione lyase